jgi:hypothetical protein
MVDGLFTNTNGSEAGPKSARSKPGNPGQTASTPQDLNLRAKSTYEELP